jgi:hypothetical protein
MVAARSVTAKTSSSSAGHACLISSEEAEDGLLLCDVGNRGSEDGVHLCEGLPEAALLRNMVHTELDGFGFVCKAPSPACQEMPRDEDGERRRMTGRTSPCETHRSGLTVRLSSRCPPVLIYL